MPITAHIRRLVDTVVRHFPNGAYRDHRRLLNSLFETAFIASTISDEGRSAACAICVFVTDSAVDDRPEFIRSDRWTLISLKEPIILTAERLARLSQAIRPDASAIAVRPAGDNSWSVWALVDQEHLYYGFRHYRGDQFYPRAGNFQIEIIGPGLVAVYHNATLLAQLRGDSVTAEFHDVFHEGPVANVLNKYARAHRSAVLRALRRWEAESLGLGAKEKRSPIAVPGSLFDLLVNRSTERWLQALSGILLRIRSLRHGRALLVVPRASSVDLKLNHRIDYRRMSDTLVERSVSEVVAWVFRHFGIPTCPAEELHCIVRHLEEAVRRNSDAIRATAGAMEFIASLSGVDGLVLAAQGMNIRGFGVEITAKEDPKVAFRALNAAGTTGESVDPTQWGTRHRSMIRYCAQHDGSIGFVVSQDGDVKAVMRVEDRVVIWPSVTVERQPLLPFEAPCPHCSLVGSLYPLPDNRDG